MANSIVQTSGTGPVYLDVLDSLTTKARHLDALTTMLSCAPQQFLAVNEDTQRLLLDLAADLAGQVREAAAAVASAPGRQFAA